MIPDPEDDEYQPWLDNVIDPPEEQEDWDLPPFRLPVRRSATPD